LVTKEIAKVLRKIGNSECIERAKNIENDSHQTRTLNLRSLSLKPNDIIALSAVLQEGKASTPDFIRSISFSYNKQIGDIGVSALVNSLPSSIGEIGLVDCGIGNKGGSEMLFWLKTLPHLKMICIEQNNFSSELKLKYKVFKKNNPQIIVVI
jgi:hypothetical protein